MTDDLSQFTPEQQELIKAGRKHLGRSTASSESTRLESTPASTAGMERVDNEPSDLASTAERPPYIEAKYWTGNLEESLVKQHEGYLAAQKKISDMGAKKDVKDADVPTIDKKDGAPSEAPKAGAFTADLRKQLSEEFVKNNGKLTDETMSKVNGLPVSQELILEHLALQQEVARLRQETLLSATLADAGSVEARDAALEWARQNYSKEEADFFDEAQRSGDPKRIRREYKLLMERKQRATQPLRRQGTAPLQQPGPAKFKNRDELYKAIDPALMSRRDAVGEKHLKDLMEGLNIR